MKFKGVLAIRDTSEMNMEGAVEGKLCVTVYAELAYTNS